MRGRRGSKSRQPVGWQMSVGVADNPILIIYRGALSALISRSTPGREKSSRCAKRMPLWACIGEGQGRGWVCINNERSFVSGWRFIGGCAPRYVRVVFNCEFVDVMEVLRRVDVSWLFSGVVEGVRGKCSCNLILLYWLVKLRMVRTIRCSGVLLNWDGF